MRRYLLIALLLLGAQARAESSLVSINLQHRSASEVIEILRPMLEAGGSISGNGYKLFIRSTDDNIAQLQQMIAKIDVAARNLLVTVSMNPELTRQQSNVEARVSVQDGVHAELGGHAELRPKTPADKGRIKYDVRMYERAQQRQHPQMQQVRVSEGLWASIYTGESIPVTTRTRNADGTVTDTFHYQAVSSGFRILPRVHGDTVTLTIRPQSQAKIQGGNGTYSSSEMETSVSGKLGSWIALGSVAQTEKLSGTGIAYGNRQIRSQSNQIYVKVDLAKP